MRFVLEALGVTPEIWQAEALVHLADRPETFEQYVEDLLVPESVLSTFEYTRLHENYTNGVFGKVSIRSGHGVGKSAVMSWAGLWFICTHYPCKIPCTAPSGHQLDDVLWPEVDKWRREMPETLQYEFEQKSDLLSLREAPKQAFMVARTARKEQPEALQGFHSDNLLFIIDEASGIEDIIFQVAEGALSSDNARIIMAGNPTRVQGYFFNSHNKMRQLWHTMKVSCVDVHRESTANYQQSQAIQYGEDSNVYRVRVLGEFPTGDDDAVIQLDLVESALTRDVSPVGGPVIWGLDIARFGDDRTALAKRQGNKLLDKIQTWRNKDTMQIVGLITDQYEKAQVKPDAIMTDVIGIGAGVVDRMRESGLPVRGINVAESPAIKPKFARLRDELWWRAREWFEAKDCRIPPDQDLIDELIQPKYALLSTGKILVESKSELKKRIMGPNKSPDKADAFILTFASGQVKRARKIIKYPKLRVA